MMTGYLAALVERHTAQEPAVAPRARTAFEPDPAAPDPLAPAPSTPSFSGALEEMEEVDAVAEPRTDISVPRAPRRRRIRAIRPEPMDEIVAPDPGPAPLTPPAPRRPRPSSPVPPVDHAPEPETRAVDAPAHIHPAPSPRVPAAAERPAARTPAPRRAEAGPSPVPPAPRVDAGAGMAISPAGPRMAPRVDQARQTLDAAPVPRIDAKVPAPARRERGMDARPFAIDPATEPPPPLPPRGAGRRGIDVRPAETARGERPAEERREADAPVPAATPPSAAPSVVMVQPVVRSAPLPPAVAEAAEAPAPVIEVSIGRIEVRATQAPASPAPVRRAQSALSLDDYLRRRGGGR